MKRSTTSSQRVSLQPRVPNNVINDPLANVTLSDIHKKLVELLVQVGTQKASRKAVRLSCVKDMTGESRSQIYARMNTKCAAYDPTWPLPFYIGKSPRWWHHEIDAWLEARAASTPNRKHGELN